MKSKPPPPPANVDNVLPGLLEQIRARRQAADALADAPPADAASQVGDATPDPSDVPAAGPRRAADAAGFESLRNQVRGLKWLLAIALAGVAVALVKLFG